MGYLPAFKLWLITKKYSSATIRNYLVDISKFFDYLRYLPQPVSFNSPADTNYFLSPRVIALYLKKISPNPNSARYLSSLNRFCLFAIDQHLISVNPLKIARKKLRSSSNNSPLSDIDNLINIYQKYLSKQKTAPATIKNYINDLKQYISWLEHQSLET